ncbi:fungal-specific transcription factor domain-containing protein [Amylocarpus encephaloides]|uniref:Fungal-specific transcription factor domain-containing protein n=1 Tax=Amylocarpus encephaloides TaxID=45428 RepID=A0A9P8C3I3_9HELO|nr:fungal-specific transcription factor domain-containing protein [Amylocarpus encephaloides]
MMSARPQVGIERLPARRMSNEPRESMNCKSCRKRKIKCNRLRPTCEACQVFQCPCIYDAVPKKRGPKTDVLEALLKRVDGLEKKLKDEKNSNSPTSEENSGAEKQNAGHDTKLQVDTTNVGNETAVYSPDPVSETSPAGQQDLLLDTYFTRCHGKPYFILDETTARQRIQLGLIPAQLLSAIHAVSARYTPHPNGYHAAIRSSEDYALRARAELDIDDPSIDNLQTLLLLSMTFAAAGKGKKGYMMLVSGMGMAVALELHREFDAKCGFTPVEKEMRRRLFWACYVMDRFTASGSKRPSLLADKSILVKLPTWSPGPSNISIEGEYFQNGSNLQYHGGTGKKCQGSSGMLIDIVRILGITNRYLAAGGVKGDSHFPWHSLSNISKIRQELDVWASGTQEVFSSVDNLFGQPDSTTLVLSKLVYHLIHCLIYRPFLPIDLAELAGTGQHQSWQIEATNLCFLHANAIAELVELGKSVNTSRELRPISHNPGKQSPSVEWLAFVGYCISTAGTVHVHGSHYRGSFKGEVYSASADFLSREMQQLSELRYAWSSAQHQRETLQTIYSCHSELVNSLASDSLRYSPVFHLEDFFNRYSELGPSFDGAHISFSDILVDSNQETYKGHGLYEPRTNQGPVAESSSAISRPQPKRKSSSIAARKKHLDLKIAHRNSHPEGPFMSPTAIVPSSSILGNSSEIPPPRPQSMHDHSPISTFSNNPAMTPHLSRAPFSPPYSYSSLNSPENYDPMFGMPQMGFGYGSGMGSANANEGMTPGARSTGESTETAGTEEKDPFLTLLEQLAENEHSRGGPSELDFFLGGGTG